MSNVNGGNADYGEDTTVNPGPWLILATTLFCILLMIILFLCLVNFGRRYKKYQAPFDEDTPAAPTQDSDEEENDEYGGDEVSVDKELGVRIMTPSVEEQCSKSEDEGLSSYKPSYRSDNDIDSSISQSKESTKSTSSFAQKPIHALFDRLLVPPYPDDNESESNLGTSDRSGKLVARLNDVMDTRADIRYQNTLAVVRRYRQRLKEEKERRKEDQRKRQKSQRDLKSHLDSPWYGDSHPSDEPSEYHDAIEVDKSSTNDKSFNQPKNETDAVVVSHEKAPPIGDDFDFVYGEQACGDRQ